MTQDLWFDKQEKKHVNTMKRVCQHKLLVITIDKMVVSTILLSKYHRVSKIKNIITQIV